MKKRIVSIILTICMMITMLPITAIGNEEIVLASETNAESTQKNCTISIVDQDGELIVGEGDYYIRLEDYQTGNERVVFHKFTTASTNFVLEFNETGDKILYNNLEYDYVGFYGTVPEGYECRDNGTWLGIGYSAEYWYSSSNSNVEVINIEKDLLTEKDTYEGTYQILTHNGECIEGANMSICLSNSEIGYGHKSEDDITIAQANSDTIAYEIACRNNRFVYNDNTYAYLYVNYELPSQYVNEYGESSDETWYYDVDAFLKDGTNKIINVTDLYAERENYNCSYKVITKKGDLVEKAEIVVALSGNDKDDVIIANSSNGIVEYSLSGVGNFIIYNDEMYSNIVITYTLPSGYTDVYGNVTAKIYDSLDDDFKDKMIYAIDLSNEDEPHPDGIILAKTDDYEVIEYCDEDGWYSYSITWNTTATAETMLVALSYVPEYARSLSILMSTDGSIHISNEVLQALETRQIWVAEFVDTSGIICGCSNVSGNDDYGTSGISLQISKNENQDIVGKLQNLGASSDYTYTLYDLNGNIELNDSNYFLAFPITGAEKDDRDSIKASIYYYDEVEDTFSLFENIYFEYIDMYETMYVLLAPGDITQWGTYVICYEEIEKEVQTPVNYNIVFNGNGATSGAMSSMTNCICDTTYTLTNNTFKRVGYTFVGWNTKVDGTGTAYSNGASVKNLTSTNGATVTLYAQWKKDVYTITYELNGGTNNNSNPTSYDVTSTIILQNPTRTGYTFAGWYSDKNFTNKVTAIAKGSTGNKTFYAKWIANAYNIKFDGNGATSGKMSSMSNKQYDISFNLTANAFKKKGYTFTGWNTQKDGKGASFANKASVKNLTSENGKTVTLYAQWQKTKYKITYKLNGGKNNKSNKSAYYVTTKTFKLKNPTRKGYTFKGWYSDKKCTKKVTKITKGTTGNKTYYAKWVKTKYKITYNLNKGKNNKSNKKTYYVTTKTFKLKNPTRKGYVFKGWYSDKKCTKKVTKIKKGSTGNIKLYAKWVKK